MSPADPQQRRQWREALTRLTRLAQRQPEAKGWLEDMLRRNMPDVLPPAFEVAEETGDPLPEVLARVLSADASTQAHEAVARSVPMDATVLQDLAIASVRALLGQDPWPAGEDAPVRRHALRVALASRLSAAGRLDEARTAAVQALASIPDDSSSRARSVDAYDVLARCQLAAGDPRGAQDSAERALNLRQSLDDPFRGQAEGERKLGTAFLAGGQPERACQMLVHALAHTRELLADARDTRFSYEDQLAAGADDLHIVVTTGWNPNGFDEIVLDQGYSIGFLIASFQGCLGDLLTAVEEHGERIKGRLLSTVQAELAAAYPLLRRELNDTVLRLRVLRFLSSGPASLMPAISEDEFDAMADEAIAANSPRLAAFVRMTEAEYLRRQEPVDRRALMGALSHLSHFVTSADAVTVMREAVEAAGDDPVSRALMLHNLARRLSANAQPAEGFAASSEAVGLLSEAFLAQAKMAPLGMAALFETLVQRGLESSTEIAFSATMVAAAEKMLNDLGHETGADLSRAVSATCGLFDSTMRQGDTATAERLATAVSRLATLRPDDEAIQLARAMLASRLLWAALENGMRDRAREWLAEVAASARNAPDVDALTVELGKCAADMVGAYTRTGDFREASQLAREFRATLLSETYLAVRRRDLGGDQAGYVRAITRHAEQHYEPG